MTAVARARQEWKAGHARFAQEVSDPTRADELHRQLEVVMDELRRRVGGTFTLEELASAYVDADMWVLDVVGERAPTRGWARTTSMVADAAFHLYSRAAQDYEP
jgi:hypothetical protein